VWRHEPSERYLPAPEPEPAPEPNPEPEEDQAPEPERELSTIPPAVLPLLAALLLVWSLATLVGDVHWGQLSTLPVGLASFSPLVILPALVVIALAARRRSWVAVALSAVAAAVPWTFMIGYMLPAPAPRGPTVPLRALLVTAHDGTANAAEITAAARTQGADLVVVTEMSTGLAHDLATAGLPRWLAARYVSAPDGAPAGAGIAIFSRYPVENVEPLTGTQWPAVRARVVVNDRSVTLVAGHTGRPSLDRLDHWRRDLQLFGEAAKVKGPVLVLANLNATPWHAQFRRLVSGRLHDAGDVFGRGMRPTWPAWSPVPLLPTDHALVAGAGVTSLTSLAIAGTDHRALSVELQLPTP
jgi:endonuclease/exonuclease/phosphatase (EEP) superfamily protein YafD